MKCSRIKRKLSAFLDNEVSEEERQFITEHLKSCEHCCKEMEKLSQVSDFLNLIEDVEVSPYFITRLKQRIVDQEQKSLIRLPLTEWIKRAFVPAVTTVLVAFSLFIGGQLGKAIYQAGDEDVMGAEIEVADFLGTSTFSGFTEGSLGKTYSSVLTGGK